MKSRRLPSEGPPQSRVAAEIRLGQTAPDSRRETSPGMSGLGRGTTGDAPDPSDWWTISGRPTPPPRARSEALNPPILNDCFDLLHRHRSRESSTGWSAVWSATSSTESLGHSPSQPTLRLGENLSHNCAGSPIDGHVKGYLERVLRRIGPSPFEHKTRRDRSNGVDFQVGHSDVVVWRIRGSHGHPPTESPRHAKSASTGVSTAPYVKYPRLPQIIKLARLNSLIKLEWLWDAGV